MTSGSEHHRQPELLFVHGDFGDGFDTWGPICPLLAGRCRAVIVDRPGFGAPIAEEERFSIAHDASYILRAVTEMQLRSFHLVGHSYGGLVALEMAARHPEVVRSLHLIEPPLFALVPDTPAAVEMDRRARQIQQAHGEAGDEATTEAFLSMIGADQAIARLRGTPEWTRLCAYAERFARSEPAGSYPATTLDRLAPSLPLALYTGGRSHPALRATLQAMSERFPRAPVIDVPGAGHAVQMSGAPFVDPLLEFVVEAEDASRGDSAVANASGK